MRLSALLATLPQELAPTGWVRAHAEVDPVIRGISYDSRRVAPGDLFVALPGAVVDGHDYIPRALAAGAAAVLCERLPDASLIGECPAAMVPDSRRAMAPVAMRFFGEPASELSLIGITGTNGKTSTAYLVESILIKAGLRTGLIGTVEIRYAGERMPAVNTTPESLDLQRTLRNMCTQNVEAVSMEVSSHGLELGRVRGCRFRVGAFTNLTQDHLDFHGDMASYRASKALLFGEHMVPGGHAVLNVDDDASAEMARVATAAGCQLIRCARAPGVREAEVRVLGVEGSLQESRVRMALPEGELELELPLIGDFNVENVMVACGVASAMGIAAEHILAGVAACPQVPGRMEVVRAAEEAAPTVVVDYAHTPDAVAKLLGAVRPLAAGRVIAVFGCGGDRDRAKRPLMAEAVARGADLAIVTSDNPRTEDPDRILDDVVAGLASWTRCEPSALMAGERRYAVIRDRREAIRAAIGACHPEDTVVLAGKGHEDYQIIGREKLPFDDRKEAERALRARSGEEDA